MTADFPMPRECPFDPPGALREMRQDEPVAKVRLWNGQDVWLITRFDDVRSILTDPRVSADSARPGYPGVNPGMALLRDRYRTFISMDAPEHTHQRRMLTGEFTHRKIDALKPRIGEIVDNCIDRILEQGPPADLLRNLTLPLPLMIVCDMLGVPEEDGEFFRTRAAILASGDSTAEEAEIASRELCDEYIGDMIDARGDDPGDDLLGRLVVQQMGKGHISRKDLISMVRLLLVAGHETSANTMALGLLALLENRDQMLELVEDPTLMDGAVEEVLRYVDAAHSGRRRLALDDIEIGGQLIRAGEGIIAHNPSADRDARAFDDPDRFDIHRDARHHVAFGFGVHQCLGQPLARAEIHAVLSTLLQRIPTIRLDGSIDDLTFREEMFVYGVDRVPVTW